MKTTIVFKLLDTIIAEKVYKKSNKKHSENADTSTSMTYEFYMQHLTSDSTRLTSSEFQRKEYICY